MADAVVEVLFELLFLGFSELAAIEIPWKAISTAVSCVIVCYVVLSQARSQAAALRTRAQQVQRQASAATMDAHDVRLAATVGIVALAGVWLTMGLHVIEQGHVGVYYR